MTPPSDAEIERIFREEYGRVVASLVRRFGSIDIAEDAAAEALLAAVERWPGDGVPPNPGGWLTTTAARKAIDKIRRESHRDAKHQQAAMIEHNSLNLTSPPARSRTTGSDSSSSAATPPWRRRHGSPSPCVCSAG